MSRLASIGLLLLALVIGFPIKAGAASPKPSTTTITIDGEFCGSCLKKLKTHVAEVPGVASVGGNVEKKTVTVSTKPSITLSPKALWEAVEKAGKKPAKLTGPSGTFTAKPKS